jgi:hypothetical protein
VRTFTLYSFDRSGRLTATETFLASDQNEAKARAESRRAFFADIELWDGPICLLRSKPRRGE